MPALSVRALCSRLWKVLFLFLTDQAERNLSTLSPENGNRSLSQKVVFSVFRTLDDGKKIQRTSCFECTLPYSELFRIDLEPESLTVQ
jgi:hypothetical protein